MSVSACLQGLPSRQVNDQRQVAVRCPCGWLREWIAVWPSPRAAKAIVQGQYADHGAEKDARILREITP